MDNNNVRPASELIAASLNWRYATKQYDPSQKLSAEQLTAIKTALRLAPSSYGLEAWKFIHVTDPKLREQLKAAAYGQSPLTDASDIFVLAAYRSIDEKFVDAFVADISKTRQVPVEELSGLKQMVWGSVSSLSPADLAAWLASQVYIPLGMALLTAAELSVDATPMEGFDRNKFNEILGLNELNLDAKAILALGFRSSEDKYQKMAKVRWSEEQAFLEK